MERQRTIQKKIEFSGKGVHTGGECRVKLLPAEVDTGILFVKKPENVKIEAHYSRVLSTTRGTTLGYREVKIHTVEHILSALWGMGIDNIVIEVEGDEFPAFDGSSAPYVDYLIEAGIVEQDARRKYVEIKRPVLYRGEDGVNIFLYPSDTLEISFGISYENHPVISSQYATFNITPETYKKEIAPARTYILEEEIEKVRKMGLAKGGSLSNAVVIKKDGVLAEGGLRFFDEPVRHKILDFIGDMALLGKRFKGKIVAERSGHRHHVEFVKLVDEQFGGEKLSIHDILKIMPHRFPFLLVDRIEYLGEDRVVGIKNVTYNEPFFQGHFPTDPVMPGVLIIEAMAQVGGFMLLHKVKDKENKLLYFSAIDKARFKKPVRPGDVIEFELTLLRFGGRVAKMKGVARVEGKIVAEAELVATLVESNGRNT